MKTLLDLENWNRKEHYLHFRQMQEPFFGITVEIDCTKAYPTSKKLGVPFYMYYLHKTLVAVNEIECFRYRINKDQIFIYDRIDASTTVSREDETFGFSLMEFTPDLTIFAQKAALEIDRIQTTTGLFTRSFDTDNLIHFSALPWVNFTSLSHARSYTFPDSCPKISFGKMMVSESGKRTMAMAIHVHHGLIDGLHIGQFVDYFQDIMNH